MNTPDPLASPLIDQAVVKELREILEEDFADLIHTLLRNLPGQLADIQTAFERGDAEALSRAAHKLKSGSGSIGAPQLAELARCLERLGRRGDLAAAPPVLEQLRASAAQTRVAFQKLLDG